VLRFASAFVFTSLHFSSSLSSRREFAFGSTILHLFRLLFPFYFLLFLITNLFTASVDTSTLSSFFFLRFLHWHFVGNRLDDLSAWLNLPLHLSPLSSTLPTPTFYPTPLTQDLLRKSLNNTAFHLLLLTLSRQFLPRTTSLCQLLVSEIYLSSLAKYQSRLSTRLRKLILSSIARPGGHLVHS
jgi:hypothetical protein